MVFATFTYKFVFFLYAEISYLAKKIKSMEQELIELGWSRPAVWGDDSF